MQNNGVHIYSVFDGELHKVKIDDVNFYMLPFVKPIMVRRFYPEVETYEDAVRTIIENTDIDKSQKMLYCHINLLQKQVRKQCEVIRKVYL